MGLILGCPLSLFSSLSALLLSQAAATQRNGILYDSGVGQKPPFLHSLTPSIAPSLAPSLPPTPQSSRCLRLFDGWATVVRSLWLICPKGHRGHWFYRLSTVVSLPFHDYPLSALPRLPPAIQSKKRLRRWRGFPRVPAFENGVGGEEDGWRNGSWKEGRNTRTRGVENERIGGRTCRLRTCCHMSCS